MKYVKIIKLLPYDINTKTKNNYRDKGNIVLKQITNKCLGINEVSYE